MAMAWLQTTSRVLSLLGSLMMVACYETNQTMTNPKQLKTATEILTIAGKTASSILPDEAAETLPVPRRVNERFVIQILYYREFGSPGERRVEAPDHCMWLEPESGKVIRFWACALDELGIPNRPDAVPGAGIRPGMTAEEYTRNHERIAAISQSVWAAFIHGGIPDDPDTRRLAREYRRLVLETTKAEVAAYLVAAAPDFFRWLDTVPG